MFSDWLGEGDPLRLHFIGTDLNSLDLNELPAYIKEGYKISICKYDLVNGGRILSNVKVTNNMKDESDIINYNNIFQGKYDDFVKFLKLITTVQRLYKDLDEVEEQTRLKAGF
jgi:hypothetical protein